MPVTIERDLQYVDPESLIEEFKGMGKGMAVTHGFYELECEAAVNDLDWNHMDPHHCPFIHRTYGEASRLACGRNFQLSLTHYPSSPLFVAVTDVRLKPGLFYQCFSVFNLVFVMSVIRSLPCDTGSQQRIDWYIVSRRFWSFLHPMLNRKMKKLNVVQNAEDAPIRQRRRELRNAGFRFKSDIPDYIVASALDNHTIPPALTIVQDIALVETGPSQPTPFRIEALDFLYLFQNGVISLWPGACPHEGGPLCDGRLEDGGIVCPWHGLRFPPLRLTGDVPEGVIGGVRFVLGEDVLNAAPATLDA
ncbi:MAG: Rieske 2Fe-2S domain-containing protein [Verrucomicrobia bacterium]|nr:Rieske 2Fe-2S domain-containing protein [Verrucomicrobiota bacterium]